MVVDSAIDEDATTFGFDVKIEDRVLLVIVEVLAGILMSSGRVFVTAVLAELALVIVLSDTVSLGAVLDAVPVVVFFGAKRRQIK